jgi:hypothetical protein
MNKNMKLVISLSTMIIAVSIFIAVGFFMSRTDSAKESDSTLETTIVSSKSNDVEDSHSKEEVVSPQKEEDLVDEEKVTKLEAEQGSNKDDQNPGSSSDTKDNSKDRYMGIVIKAEQVDKEDSTAEYYIYGYDHKGKKLWTNKWTGLQLTELPVASQFTIHNSSLLIEVGSVLYSIDIHNGQRLWKVDNVGSSAHAPVVDSKDQTIYVTGFYGPFITAVTQEGKLKWQKDFTDDDMYWPYDTTVEADGIVVKAEGTESTFDRDGNLLERKELPEGESGWLDTIKTDYSINASSYLTEKTIVHKPDRIWDGNKTTAWVEGKANDGIGEYVFIDFGSNKDISTINIINGYAKEERLYYSNNRVRILGIEFDNGKSFEYTLQDKTINYQTIVLKEAVNTDSVKLIIKDVYKGNKYRDTCISEVEIN